MSEDAELLGLRAFVQDFSEETYIARYGRVATTEEVKDLKAALARIDALTVRMGKNRETGSPVKSAGRRSRDEAIIVAVALSALCLVVLLLRAVLNSK